MYISSSFGIENDELVLDAVLISGTPCLHDLKHVSGNFVVIMDADLSHHPKYPPSLMETRGSIVTETSYVKGGGLHGWNVKRKLTSRGGNVVVQTLLWPALSDLTGSFRLESLFVDRVYGSSKPGGSEIVGYRCERIMQYAKLSIARIWRIFWL
ncbi:hypothetical protein RHMOL_Rhmol06G0016100 [Rhododendron molle]|uniref:Uncharacterized protein n=1 Tax=Rhododendron molle TaxID=49168 RepID=A0ACC0N809_RHOML|nr:hypothetical protein RHMOL_Rhmol06G0016100 [Rhododendron molle]